MMTKEYEFYKATGFFDKLCKLVEQAGQEGQRIDEVERMLLPRLLELGRILLKTHVEAHGNGDEGPKVVHDGQKLNRSREPHAKRYLSVFGELSVERWVYCEREGQAQRYSPVDAALGLPAGDNSYFLEDLQQRFCVKGAFNEAISDLHAILGIQISVRTAEGMNQQMATFAAGFQSQIPAPPPESEADLLVITADGKGIPMRRPRTCSEQTCGSSAEQKHCGQGRRKTQKQMACVGAIYSIDPFLRTVDDILNELDRTEVQKNRPRPQNKRLWAELTRSVDGETFTGRESVFAKITMDLDKRDPHRKKALICLLDGEHALWDLQRFWMRRAVGILDLYHVSERVWQVAYCLHPHGSLEARTFVRGHLRRILEGHVGYTIRAFRYLLSGSRLRGEKRRTVQSAITYFTNNRDHMKYDAYLAAGYPIGSGVAEGACRHLVKDRMEQSGMRWTRAGAQSMLDLRGIYLNGEWNDFIQHRIVTEQDRLYCQPRKPRNSPQLRKAP